ncbi:hypothetical protein [Halobaculum sp. EA56]|uniref:hypothetical protein n=1 Tax=Halobaculum sp. EA56 TaxID=3421648 RepID=UPI003EC01BC3
MSRSKGDRAERELSNLLEDRYRFAAMPAGSSGSGTDRARPDIMAARRRLGRKRGAWDTPPTYSETKAIEVKAWRNAKGQLDADEVRALRSFATRAGGTALIVIKPDLRGHDQWHVFEAWELHSIAGSGFSVRDDELPGDTLDEAFGPRYDTEANR